MTSGSESDIHGRRALLTAALGFVLIERPPRSRALAALHAWLDSWAGIGRIVVGMERQGFALTVTRLSDGWRARFFRDPSLSDDGFGAAATPWKAVQRAAWMALRPRER